MRRLSSQVVKNVIEVHNVHLISNLKMAGTWTSAISPLYHQGQRIILLERNFIPHITLLPTFVFTFCSASTLTAIAAGDTETNQGAWSKVCGSKISDQCASSYFHNWIVQVLWTVDIMVYHFAIAQILIFKWQQHTNASLFCHPMTSYRREILLRQQEHRCLHCLRP